MKKTAYISILAIIVISVYANDSFAKKVIQLGYDDPGTSDFEANLPDMKASGYDGTSFTARPNTGTNNEFTWQAWGTTVFSRASMQHAVDELNAVDFNGFSENFLRLNVTPGNVDWFDDFSVVTANCGTAAWIVQKGGQKGIMFDPEPYEGQLWDYRTLKYKSNKTFAQYQAQVRLRGQQVMAAMQAEDQNVVVFMLLAYSYVWGPSQINGNTSLLPTTEYGLLPSFIDGMLDVAGSGVRFVDGYEASYGYKTLSQFQNTKTVMTTGCLPIVADDAKYAAKFGFGFALWLDYNNHLGQWHYSPSEFYLNHFPPAEFESSLKNALSVSDEYVWIFNAGVMWWNVHGVKDVPVAYQDALRFGKELEFMSFVPVGDSGNAKDTRPVTFSSVTSYLGNVDYAYKIGKYEVTNAQYCAFLNAVAQSDPHFLYDEMMGDRGYPWNGGIIRSGGDGSYVYTVVPGREHLPVNWVSWRSAARMANWMHNGMANDPASTESGAYDASTFTGTGGNKTDQAGHFPSAKYWIPTLNEWYKAAFYKGGGLNSGYWTYATQSDTAPDSGPLNNAPNKANYAAENYDFGLGANKGDMVSVGRYSMSPGAYGTFDQSGNVLEYCEDWTAGAYAGNYRTLYGGAWKWNDTEQLRFDGRNHVDPATGGYYERGFRLAKEIGCSATLSGDLNNDCKVNFTDFEMFVNKWLQAETVLFNVQFTNDTAGSAPATAAAVAGVPTTTPTLLIDQAGKNVFTRVQNTYTDSVTGQVFGTGKVCVFTDNDSTGYSVMLFQGAVADQVNSGIYTVSTDILIDSRADATSNFLFGVKNQARSLELASFFIELDTGVIRSGAASYGTMSKGYSHHIDWVIDMGAGRTEIHLDGVFKGYVTFVETALFGEADLFMSQPAVGTVAFDNYAIRSGKHVMSGGSANDFNGDGKVNLNDFATLASNWMKCNLVSVDECN